jgi:diguanylate cyclase (GGDEF)-like protein
MSGNTVGRWLAGRRVQTKLLLLVGVLAVVAVGVGVLSVGRLAELRRAGDDVYTLAMTPALRAAEIKVLILAKRTSALRHASAPDRANKLRYEAAFREQADQLDAALTKYPGEAARIRELLTLSREYNQILLQEYMPASLRMDPVAVQRARERASPLGDRSLVVLDELIAEQNTRAEAIRDRVTQRYQEARTVVVAALLIGLATALTLALYVARLIVRPLQRVEWVAAGLAAGELTRSSGITGADEIARLAGALDDAVRVRRRLEDELLERNAELHRLSTTDLLTDLANRRHLEQRLEEAASLIKRHGGDYAVLLLDVDNFKKINDGLGHHGGDVVLRAVAERLRTVVRREDLAGRWGGEEFLVLLPTTDLAGALALAERVRAAIAEDPVTVPGAEPWPVTVSVGAAAGLSDDVEGLLSRADAALYAAKAGGRDRVVAAVSC